MNYSYPSRRSPAMEKAGVYPKITALLLTISQNDNINGDPASGGRPRQLSNGHGIQSMVSVWRKYRDMIDQLHPAYQQIASDMGLSLDEYQILVKRLPGVENAKAEMAKIVNAAKGDIRHHDYRLKGGMLLGKNEESDEDDKKADKKEKIEKDDRMVSAGIIQMGNAQSVAPITIDDMQITSIIGHGSKGSAMGMTSAVRFGVYPMPIYMNTSKYMWETLRTRPTDVELFRRLLPHITEMRSSVRNNWYVRNFYWYEHGNMLGDIPDWKIIKALTPKLADGVDPLDNDAVAKEENYVFFNAESEDARTLFKDNIAHLHDFA